MKITQKKLNEAIVKYYKEYIELNGKKPNKQTLEAYAYKVLSK